MAPPFKQAEFDILYGTGISREGSLIDFGVEHEIVRKSGAWYTYDGDQLGQGKENSRKYLIEHAATANEIEQKIKTKLGIIVDAKAAAAAASQAKADANAELAAARSAGTLAAASTPAKASRASSAEAKALANSDSSALDNRTAIGA